MPYTIDGGYSGAVTVALRKPRPGKIAPALVTIESEALGDLLLTDEQASALVAAIETVLEQS